MKKWHEEVEWGHALEYTPGLSLAHQQAVYAECQGTDDPICGRARFSLHGCNGGRPSREAFLRGTGD